MKEFVLIHADWCGPCQSYKPIIDKVSKALSVKIKKVNMESEEFLPYAESVRSLPTLLVMKNGEVYTEAIGVMNEQQLTDFIKDHGEKEA